MDQQQESSGYDESSSQEAEYTGGGEDERQHLIAETAYFIAEKRGFKGGNPLEDWIQAETKIAALQTEGKGDQ